jgi:hypothetical protein
LVLAFLTNSSVTVDARTTKLHMQIIGVRDFFNTTVQYFIFNEGFSYVGNASTSAIITDVDERLTEKYSQSFSYLVGTNYNVDIIQLASKKTGNEI